MTDVLIQWMNYIVELFHKGGLVMYPLLLCSVVALAITVEKCVTLRRRRIFPPALISTLNSYNSGDDIEIVRISIRNFPGSMQSLAEIVLEEYHNPPEIVREYLEDQGKREMTSMERGLPFLETIAAIAPLLGLLGTVLGLKNVFAEIAAGGLGDPTRLSDGISQALITTVFGLVIGIPALAFYNYFESKILIIARDLERYSIRLLRKLRRVGVGIQE